MNRVELIDALAAEQDIWFCVVEEYATATFMVVRLERQTLPKATVVAVGFPTLESAQEDATACEQTGAPIQ